MKIKEAALATGLTERAIRLYEEHGLISPSVTVKNGRDFRDYTEENITRLKTIAALRRALFTDLSQNLLSPSKLTVKGKSLFFSVRRFKLPCIGQY